MLCSAKFEDGCDGFGKISNITGALVASVVVVGSVALGVGVVFLDASIIRCDLSVCCYI